MQSSLVVVVTPFIFYDDTRLTYIKKGGTGSGLQQGLFAAFNNNKRYLAAKTERYLAAKTERYLAAKTERYLAAKTER